MEVDVPLGTGSWTRLRADAADINLVNRFYEENPENSENQAGLIERPALINFLEAGTGPGRRVFRQAGFSNGDLFHVSGNELYKHHMNINNVVTTTLISGFIDGTGAPDMATNRSKLWITDGYSLSYTDGIAALTPIATPDTLAIVSIDTFNDYILCVQANSDRFYWIRPEALIIDPLDFSTAERFPDKILQVRVVGDEFWLLGEKSIEVWRATGDTAAPFQRIEGRAFNFGIYGGTAVRMKDTSVLCVADDGTVFSIAGNPTAISNPSVAERTRDAILLAKQNGL